MNKSKESVWVESTMKRNITHIMRIPEEEKGTEQIFKAIITEKFLNLG